MIDGRSALLIDYRRWNRSRYRQVARLEAPGETSAYGADASVRPDRHRAALTIDY